MEAKRRETELRRELAMEDARIQGEKAAKNTDVEVVGPRPPSSCKATATPRVA